MNAKDNVIFDLDGTLCDIQHRLHFIRVGVPDYDAFYRACVNDRPKFDVISILDMFWISENYTIYLLSGRSEMVEAETSNWLARFGIRYDILKMRGKADNTPDEELKRKMARDLGLKPSNTVAVFDDRQKVVDMWRSEGFTCCQVDQWNEE